jgi:hypothetical protein
MNGVPACRQSARAVGLFLVFLVTVLIAAPSPTAAADDQVSVAGLIVEYGEGRISYALVPFTEDSMSGFDLLDRSGLSLLAIEFGGLGQGVCAIEGSGCDVAACRSRLCQSGDPDSPFWQYAQRRQSGEWATSPLGASSSTVADGDIEFWSWSSEPPAPRTVTLDDIAREIGVDLSILRTGDSHDPVSITLGQQSDESREVGWREVGAGAVLAGIAVAGVLALRRTRQRGIISP